MIKIIRDMLVITILMLAIMKLGEASDDGGVKLVNGCYTLVVVVDGDHGKKQITVQDCRGGRPI
tara:strand:- start:359 stop:550 length:192 start_codon:yes stop_codon:yes gene_type:complete